MSHRSDLDEPIYMKKSLAGKELYAKNVAELMYHRDLDEATAMQLLWPNESEGDLIVQLEDGPIRIRPYNLAYRHDRTCACYVAPRDSGKSVLGYHFLAAKCYIPTAYCTSTTDGVSGFYQTIIPPDQVHTEYDPDVIADIFSGQQTATRIYKEELREGRLFDPRCIVILDDCAYEGVKMRNSKAVDRLALNGRHYHADVHVMTQHFKILSKAFRGSTDLLILFANDNITIMDDVWEEYGCGMSKKDFRTLWLTVCKNEYTALIISCRGRDRYKEPADRIYYFKAYEEEAVDALMGGGKVSKDGKVIEPAQEYWQIGGDAKRMPITEAQYEVGQAEIETRMVTEETDPDDVFEPSPYSLSERTKQHVLAQVAAAHLGAIETKLSTPSK